MAKAVKVGDIGTDHDGFPPTPVTAGSPDVKFDGVPAARVGDPLAPHDKPKNPPHGRSISSGSSTVFINGKPAAITGGAISCGGVTIGGGTVNIGDAPGSSSSTKPSPMSPSPVFFDINAVVKDANGNILADSEVLCQPESGSPRVYRTDSNGVIKGIEKKQTVSKVSFKRRCFLNH